MHYAGSKEMCRNLWRLVIYKNVSFLDAIISDALNSLARLDRKANGREEGMLSAGPPHLCAG